MPATAKTITIDLLRHGEPEGGEVLRGRIDHALTEKGWQQMHKAVQRSGETAAIAHWTHIISSPLVRCRAFAESVAQTLQLQAVIDPAWQEIDYGDWDGLPLAEWRTQAAEQFRAFRQDMSRLAPPNGEDFLTFKDRVLGAWQALTELPDQSRVLLVTHGGVLRVILPTVLGMPLNQSQPLQIPFANLSRVQLQVAESRCHATLVFHNLSA